MTRATNDTTSTCESCVYWAHDKSANGIHPTAMGDCGWLSVPAWTRRYIPVNAPTGMRADAGRDCWQHTKRGDHQHNAQRGVTLFGVEKGRPGGDRTVECEIELGADGNWRLKSYREIEPDVTSGVSRP